jgi:hypothetical protein
MWSGAVILLVATMKSLLSPPLPSFKTGWQVVRLWTHYLRSGLDNLRAAPSHTHTRL